MKKMIFILALVITFSSQSAFAYDEIVIQTVESTINSLIREPNRDAQLSGLELCATQVETLLKQDQIEAQRASKALEMIQELLA